MKSGLEINKWINRSRRQFLKWALGWTLLLASQIWGVKEAVADITVRFWDSWEYNFSSWKGTSKNSNVLEKIDEDIRKIYEYYEKTRDPRALKELTILSEIRENLSGSNSKENLYYNTLDFEFLRYNENDFNEILSYFRAKKAEDSEIINYFAKKWIPYIYYIRQDFQRNWKLKKREKIKTLVGVYSRDWSDPYFIREWEGKILDFYFWEKKKKVSVLFKVEWNRLFAQNLDWKRKVRVYKLKYWKNKIYLRFNLGNKVELWIKEFWIRLNINK